MTTYIDRITFCFAIPEVGRHPARPAEASLQTLEFSESGKVYENLVPLDVSKVGDFAESFSIGVVVERDALLSQVAELKSIIESERLSSAAEIERLSSIVAGLNAALSELVSSRDAAVSESVRLQVIADSVPELQSEIDRLTELVPAPLSPRQIYPRELLGRLAFAEVVAAIRTDDDAAIYAVANLQTTVLPIDLDSEETRTLIGALVVAGILTPARLAEILA